MVQMIVMTQKLNFRYYMKMQWENYNIIKVKMSELPAFKNFYIYFKQFI